MCSYVLSDVALRVKECLAVTSSMYCKRCEKSLSLVTIQKTSIFLENLSVKISLICGILKKLLRFEIVTSHVDQDILITTIAEDRELATALLHDFFSSYTGKNFHPF